VYPWWYGDRVDVDRARPPRAAAARSRRVVFAVCFAPPLRIPISCFATSILRDAICIWLEDALGDAPLGDAPLKQQRPRSARWQRRAR
jgi:hypothetical protein